MTEILLVEDDLSLREILNFNLESAGYTVLQAGSAEEGAELLSERTALILLDVMLPGMSGFQFAHMLRHERGNSVPIIFITARSTENDLLTGFSAGADDYICKPFAINEMLARVRAVLRRSGPAEGKTRKLDYGDLHIDVDNMTVSVAGEKVALSRKEFDILIMLAQSPDTYFSRTDLIGGIWKDSPYVLDRTVDVHIARLRGKLGRYHDIIRNRSGFGYYLDSSYEV